jgi:hypothetical protein
VGRPRDAYTPQKIVRTLETHGAEIENGINREPPTESR